MKIYLNGVDDGGAICGGCGPGTVPSSFPATFGPPAIGADGANRNGKFIGVIDNLRVYNRALTADEIKRLYNMGR
jgi:hypothetical protein